jgi:hypothetical protein
MISIEMIDEFRRRTNSSYDDAKYYLERHNGDLLEAIIDFEKARSGGAGCSRKAQRANYGGAFMRFVQRLFDIKVMVTDRTERTLSIPIIFPLVMVPVWHILILLAIVLMIRGYRFSVREIRDDSFNVENIISRVKEKVRAPRNY